MASFLTKGTKAQREELETRKLSTDHMELNGWGRARLLKLEGGDQDKDTVTVMGRDGIVGTVGNSSRR